MVMRYDIQFAPFAPATSSVSCVAGRVQTIENLGIHRMKHDDVVRSTSVHAGCIGLHVQCQRTECSGMLIFHSNPSSLPPAGVHWVSIALAEAHRSFVVIWQITHSLKGI